MLPPSPEKRTTLFDFPALDLIGGKKCYDARLEPAPAMRPLPALRSTVAERVARLARDNPALLAKLVKPRAAGTKHFNGRRRRR